MNREAILTGAIGNVFLTSKFAANAETLHRIDYFSVDQFFFRAQTSEKPTYRNTGQILTASRP
jgi:hypothetical protein